MYVRRHLKYFLWFRFDQKRKKKRELINNRRMSGTCHLPFFIVGFFRKITRETKGNIERIKLKVDLAFGNIEVQSYVLFVHVMITLKR